MAGCSALLQFSMAGTGHLGTYQTEPPFVLGLKVVYGQAKFESAPQEQRRRRAGKRSSKRVVLESPFLLLP